MTHIQKLASEYVLKFELKTRTNGDKFWCRKDKECDDDLNKLIHDAHGDMMPDDYKYQFIVEALYAINEHDDLDDIDLEPDCYNSDLLKWVQSHSERVALCNEVLNEFESKDFMAIISYAQQREKEEVLHSVHASLDALCEGLEDEEEEV